jgi:hypothetical protein
MTPSPSLRLATLALLALAACTSKPPPSGLVDVDERMPEPVRPAASGARRPAPLTGLALAVSGAATELWVIDMRRVQVTQPVGTAGVADLDPIAAEAQVREVLAGLRIWAEDGAVVLDGAAPFTGRARSQTYAGVMRFSLIPRGERGAPLGALTVEVRGDEITGRVSRRSAPGQAPAWTHGGFFRAPLRRVQPRDWPPRAPRALFAEPLVDGGALLRWTAPPLAPPDVEYAVYRAGDTADAPVLAGVTRELQYADGRAAGTWYVVARTPAGQVSNPSPATTLP